MKGLIFEKPDIKKLKSKKYQIVDMHMHSAASFDCSTSLSSILKKAKRLGIGIAITDHDAIDSAVKAFNNTNGVLVIPAIEVFSKRDHHILFYFYDTKELVRFYENEVKNQPSSKTAEELIRLKKKYKCVVGLAHPTGFELWHRHKVDFDISNLDCFETINRNCSKERAEIAARWSNKYKKGMIGGSDAHKLDRIGDVLTCAKAQTRKEFLDAIIRREQIVVGISTNRIGLLKKFPRCVYKLGMFCAAKIYHTIK